jgi:hypothetical protein
MRASAQRLLLAVILFGMLGTFGFSQPAAQTQTNPPDQGAGQDVKNAGHSTKNAAKKTGHKVKHGVKKGTHKAARKTRQGAGKVEDKTQTPASQPQQ